METESHDQEVEDDEALFLEWNFWIFFLASFACHLHHVPCGNLSLFCLSLEIIGTLSGMTINFDSLLSPSSDNQIIHFKGKLSTFLRQFEKKREFIAHRVILVTDIDAKCFSFCHRFHGSNVCDDLSLNKINRTLIPKSEVSFMNSTLTTSF